MPSKARLSPLAGGQGNYRGAAEKDGPSAGWRMEHGWDGARGRTEQAYRNGTGREKERKRKGSGGGGRPTVKARRKGGGSLRSRKEGPPSVCGVSCAFACRRPPLLGKTSKEGRSVGRGELKGASPFPQKLFDPTSERSWRRTHRPRRRGLRSPSWRGCSSNATR